MRKLFSLFAALTLSVGLWAANSVITFTSTDKLYPGSIDELMDESKWEAFKAQFPEFAGYGSYMEFEMMMMMEHGGGELSFFNPNAFLDANDQVLNYTYNYDDATKTGTITFAGELVTMYGDYGASVVAFAGCSSLTSITLPEGLTSIGEYSFYYCSNLTTVNIPASLTTIGNHAFDVCSNLTSVNFATGSQLTTIGEYVFNGCQVLTTLSIPASVTEIKRWTIRACTSLNDVYVAWTTTLPTLGVAVFDATPVSSATLHVPAGTKTLYQNADQWKDFSSIVEYDPLADIKTAAIAAVNDAIAEGDNLYVKDIATHAVSFINEATNVEIIEALKTQALSNIASAKAAYGEGKTAGYNTGHTEGEEAGIAVGQGIGYQQAKDELPTEGDCGPTVIITKGDKTLTLYNVDNVEYKVTECGGYK